MAQGKTACEGNLLCPQQISRPQVSGAAEERKVQERAMGHWVTAIVSQLPHALVTTILVMGRIITGRSVSETAIVLKEELHCGDQFQQPPCLHCGISIVGTHEVYVTVTRPYTRLGIMVEITTDLHSRVEWSFSRDELRKFPCHRRQLSLRIPRPL